MPVFVGILSYGEYYLLHKRPNRGLLHSMWEFPSVENADSYDAAESGLTELVGAVGFGLSLQPVIVKELTHVFSHRKWFMKTFRGNLHYEVGSVPIEAIKKQLPKDWMLIKRNEFADYAWAGPHGKLTELCPIVE